MSEINKDIGVIKGLFDRPRVISNAGSGFRDTYGFKYVTDKNTGRKVKRFTITGRENVYDEIQASKESVDLEVLLQKYATGQASSNIPVFYGDMTKMPKNIYEHARMIDEAQAEFFKLPIEVRKEFNNDFDKFIATFGSPQFNDIFSKYGAETSTEDIKTDIMEGVEE